MIEVVRQITPALRAEVGAFLAQAPPSGACGEACLEHDPRWLEVLRAALGHQPHILLARRETGGPLVGYLPLALVASRLFGRFLVSLPYLNRAGIIAVDQEAAGELVDAAATLAGELNVKYLELRHGSPIQDAHFNAQRDEKHRMVMSLPGDEEALWKGMDAKVRNQVRKGDKSELTLRWGRGELLDDFYDVFAINMRDLGTPVFPRKLFGCILEAFEQEAELAVVDCQGQPVAGALLLHEPGRGGEGCPGVTQVPSASCLRAFNHTNANMWMYHRLLLRAIERGSGEFDFGRSSEGSGTYRFKKQWGALPRPTVWQYVVREGDINSMRPDNPRYQRRIATWQKLPVWLTRLVGPRIVRGIP